MPTGSPQDETEGNTTTKRSHKLQNQASIILAAAGYRVEQQPSLRPSDFIEAQKKPDLRIGENIFDVYFPTTTRLDGIRDEVSAKVKEEQAFRVVINLADSPFTLDDVRDILARKPVSRLLELLVIDQKGNITRLFPNPSPIR